MGTAKFLISARLLRELLELPESATIVGDQTGNVELVVSDEAIPEHALTVVPTWVRKGEATEFLNYRVSTRLLTEAEPEPASVSQTPEAGVQHHPV